MKQLQEARGWMNAKLSEFSVELHKSTAWFACAIVNDSKIDDSKLATTSTQASAWCIVALFLVSYIIVFCDSCPPDKTTHREKETCDVYLDKDSRTFLKKCATFEAWVRNQAAGGYRNCFFMVPKKKSLLSVNIECALIMVVTHRDQYEFRILILAFAGIWNFAPLCTVHCGALLASRDYRRLEGGGTCSAVLLILLSEILKLAFSLGAFAWWASLLKSTHRCASIEDLHWCIRSDLVTAFILLYTLQRLHSRGFICFVLTRRWWKTEGSASWTRMEARLWPWPKSINDLAGDEWRLRARLQTRRRAFSY